MEIEDLMSSISNPALIKDPFIKNAEFEHLKIGGYKRYTGGFSVVFPCTVNNEKWAFRCWYTELGNVKDRYEKFAKDIHKSRLPYFCDFTYVDSGICVNGKLYPTTRMKWIDGETIKDYICNNSHDKNKLKKLADRFVKMCNDMHSFQFAHGDLQHGNILVDKNDNLYLVDYDSMYTPALKGASDYIHGLPDYQHPNRKDNLLSNEKVDYFSELIIYICILAVAVRPEFVNEYQLADQERLLFSKDDYKDIRGSKIYKELQSLGGTFPLLLKVLEGYLSKHDINELEPFEKIIKQFYKEPKIKSFFLEGGNTIIKGKKAVLRWDVENVSELYINGKALSPSSTFFEIKCNKAGNERYELHAVNGLKEQFEYIDAKIISGAKIKFNANKILLHQGKEHFVELSWDIQNAKSASINYNGHTEVIPLSGKKEFDCDKSTDFEVVALNLDGKSSIRKSLSIQVCPECSVVFKADRIYTLAGVPVKLTWSVADADDVKLDGKSIEKNGSITVMPEKKTVYKLTAHDAFGYTTKEVVVNMLPLPVIKSIMVPAPEIEKEIKIECHIPRINVNIDVNLQAKTPKVNTELPALDIELPELNAPRPEFVNDTLLKYNSENKVSLGSKITEAFEAVKNKLKAIKKL